MSTKTKTAKISKAELIDLLVSDRRTFHDARYWARYSVAELVALVEAYGYNDLHCREARKLFDAASWSQYVRTNPKLRQRTPGTASAILK
jgi:hypothetical protein